MRKPLNSNIKVVAGSLIKDSKGWDASCDASSANDVWHILSVCKRCFTLCMVRAEG